MTRPSGPTRLALGLGVMVLGVLGALPFRRAPRPDTGELVQHTESKARLGDGVALQVPGQRVAVQSRSTDLQPMPAADESDEPDTYTPERPASTSVAPPPRLPDEYYPLFRPEKQRHNGQGHVVAPGKNSAPPRKELKKHTIHDGDTLPLLAERYLGDPQRADEILEVNRSVLTDPNVLPIGVEIVIPPKDPVPARPGTTDSVDVETRKLVPLPALGFKPRR